MKRMRINTNNNMKDKKYTAILTADIHLREDQPICRTDDYWAAQERKVLFLRVLQEKTGLPILDAGDLFHRWKSPPVLENWAIRNLPKDLVTIPGNHDLPSHNISLLNKSSLSVLEAAGSLRIIHSSDELMQLENSYLGITIIVHGFPWGVESKLHKEKTGDGIYHVALIHDLVCENQNQKIAKTIGGAGVLMKDATQLLKKLNYDLIVTGDNHRPFVVRFEDRLLVNPGAMMRMSADNVDATPRLYLWKAEGNVVQEVFYPISEGVVQRGHIIEEEKRNERMEHFVKMMKDDYDVTLSFEQNLKSFMDVNKIRRPVKDVIWEAVG